MFPLRPWALLLLAFVCPIVAFAQTKRVGAIDTPGHPAVVSGAQIPVFGAGPTGVLVEPTIPATLGGPEGNNLSLVSKVLVADLAGTGRDDVVIGVGLRALIPPTKLPLRVLRPGPGGALTDVTRQLFGAGALGLGETSLRFERPAAQGPGTPGFQIVSDPTIRPFEAPGFAATISTSLPIDFRGNGRPDLLACYVVNPPHPKLKVPCRVLRPQPDGSVTDVTRQMFGTGALPSMESPREIVTGDFNRDGRPDVFIAAQGWDAPPADGETNVLLISNADGTYVDRSSSLPQVPDFSHSACVGDINGDEKLDIYVGNIAGSGEIAPYFLMGKGDGTFTQKTSGLPPLIQSLRQKFLSCLLVDVDQDGRLDLVLGAHGDDVGYVDNIVLFNEGSGDFTKRQPYVAPIGPLGATDTSVLDIVSFDINRDGRPDLLLVSQRNPSSTGFGLQVLINNGDGTLADETVARLGASAARATGPNCNFLRLADFNGDGWEDFYCNIGPVEVVPRYWTSNGNGTWTPVAPGVLSPGNGFGIHAVDFDGDGRPDLLQVAHTNTGDIAYSSFLNRLGNPAVTTHPASQTVVAGGTATFTAAATGKTTPTVQWEVSLNRGATFSDVSGATSTSYSFTAAAADNGKQYRAIFSNAIGTSTSTAATLTVRLLPTMALDKTSLAFGAVNSGGAFGAGKTPPQAVRLTQKGIDPVTWTASSTAPWLIVSPSSGTGPATLNVSVQYVAGLAASQTGFITMVFAGAGNTAGPINVTLAVVPPTGRSTGPFGVFDTPVGDATVLAGSIAVTGWTLDDIEVKRVELWRDLQPGETTPPFASTPSDPRSGKVFIANGTFMDGARPDVEGLYPTTPFNYRAGWGYLMLTRGLWNQGNGTYKLHAFAFDQENNLGTIGTKTVIVSNTTATKPFGSIDTPGIGGDASGPNFGWALTPTVNGVATCKIQPSGVQVSIDSGPLQPVVYGDARTDIAGAFPGFSNTAAAGGHFIFDWSTLTNGSHTIGWLITDDCNRADGVGSRFFNVTGGTSLTAATGAAMATADLMTGRPVGESESDAAITVARGHGELPEIVQPAEAGSRTVEMTQGERIEIRVPRGFASAYQLVNGGQRRALPTGATWDADSGIFYWQPAAGFLGRYRIVFSNGPERINVRVVVTP